MDKSTLIYALDDERHIRELLAYNLEAEGFVVETFETADEFWFAMRTISPDLILLDIMLNDANGMDICKKIRSSGSKIPVVMLTAKNEEMDRILGLEMGADDYVTKPFNHLELIARVKSQLRRFTVLGSLPTPESGVYTVGGLSINDNDKTVSVDGDEVRLTPIEYKIALLLMRSPGRVFSIDEIYERVWGEDAFAADNTIAVHIRRIRDKIEIDPKNPRYLKVVWGIGYKIEKQ